MIKVHLTRLPLNEQAAYASGYRLNRFCPNLIERNYMPKNSLEEFIESVIPIWGSISSELVAACGRYLEELIKAPATEEWLAALHREGKAYNELYRDPTQGFVLLAHTEPVALYRPPHDHGRGWVMYALQQGEIEMGTYARTEAPGGSVKLVKRNSTLVRPGQVQVYLPGDIHDTRCISGPAMLFRFTERDLKKEDKEEHRVTRYVERDGVWTVGGAVSLDPQVSTHPHSAKESAC
jgi:hypothetical protein